MIRRNRAQTNISHKELGTTLIGMVEWNLEARFDAFASRQLPRNRDDYMQKE